MSEQAHSRDADDHFARRRRPVDGDRPAERASSAPMHGPAQQFTTLTNRVLQLHEELRQARSQLASYGETLVAIERSIMPQRLPKVPGLDLAVHFAELEGAGGDFYDVSCLGPGRWAVVVVDVSGHGLAAAAVLTLVHALNHGLREQGMLPSPGAGMGMLNKQLAARYLAESDRFVTAFVGFYDVRTQVLKYASAGHPPPRLIRGNEVGRLDVVSGLPLGIDGASVYPDGVVQLQPGDRVVLFTDGITEGTNPVGEAFGDQRLDEALRLPANGAAEFLDHIVESVRTFRAGRPADDDETCLVAVVNPV